jgi:hypothetical protein
MSTQGDLGWKIQGRSKGNTVDLRQIQEDPEETLEDPTI